LARITTLIVSGISSPGPGKYSHKVGMKI